MLHRGRQRRLTSAAPLAASSIPRIPIEATAFRTAVNNRVCPFHRPVAPLPGTFPCRRRADVPDKLEGFRVLAITLTLKTLNPFHAGDVLMFLTGQEEIETACQILYERMKSLGPQASTVVLWLGGVLTHVPQRCPPLHQRHPRTPVLDTRPSSTPPTKWS
jgi:hypothetical protein